MRRVTKKIAFFVFGIVLTGIYCEYWIYYIVIAQCTWPILENSHGPQQTLKALIIADTHLLGPRKGHWLDKWRREWQMHQAFLTIITLQKPDVVFVLGDLFDEGEWSNNLQFEAYVDRFYSLFSVPTETMMYVVAGNHDIGFHNNIRRGSAERFSKLLNSSSVQFLTIKDNHFVFLNSMAMEGDSCNLCIRTRKRLAYLSEKLKCSEHPTKCANSDIKKVNYSRPILMQHFPLYRLSDMNCTEPDAPPLPERNKPFRSKIDALSKEATDYLITNIKPLAVFGGHTHHGCVVHHSYDSLGINFYEYSVPSFSWRNRPDPKYMLVKMVPGAYSVSKCELPKETTIALSGIILIFIVAWRTVKPRTL